MSRSPLAVTTAALALALGLTLAPAPAARGDQPAAPPRIAYTHFVLENGLRVFVVEDHTTPMVALVTYYRVGSKDELPGKTGFAHLFEHMMFKGSAHVPDGMIDVLFEEAGGWTNAFTSSDQTVYTDYASASFLEPALWLEADRLAGLTETLDQAKLDNQREVVRNERRQSYENQPYGTAWLMIPEALWPKGHGYHWSTIGYHEDLVAATTGDVKSFFQQYYLPNNATLVVVGDVDPAKVKPLIEKYLGWIPRGPEPRRPQYKTPPPITKEVRLATTDDVQVPGVFMAWRAPAQFSAEEAPLSVAAMVLGDGKSSRLYKRLVIEERLAQEVSVYIDRGELGGTFYVVAIAKPGASADDIRAIITEEMQRLGKSPPTDAEVERVKNAHEASFLRGLEDLVNRGVLLATYDRVAGDPDFLGKDLERYRKVTPAEVSKAVSTWLQPSSRVVLVVSPQKPQPKKGGK